MGERRNEEAWRMDVGRNVKEVYMERCTKWTANNSLHFQSWSFVTERSWVWVVETTSLQIKGKVVFDKRFPRPSQSAEPCWLGVALNIFLLPFSYYLPPSFSISPFAHIHSLYLLHKKWNSKIKTKMLSNRPFKFGIKFLQLRNKKRNDKKMN